MPARRALRDIGAAHMIYDHQGRDRVDERPQFLQYVGFEIDHHMPAQRLYAAGDFEEPILGRVIDQALEEVEADAANAALVQRLKLGVADRRVDDGDPARLAF